jgi:maltose alpha-D-glucosyltransferase/alpha-amylase
VESNPELVVLPLALAASDVAGGIAKITMSDGRQLGVLTDAFALPAFARALLELIRNRERLRNDHGEIEATRTAALRQILNGEITPSPTPQSTPDGNVSVIYGDRVALKFFRRIQAGINPELEIGRHLTELEFPHSPPLLGALEYNDDNQPPMTLAVAKAFVPHAKNAWKFTLDAISRYYDRVFTATAQGHTPEAPPALGPLKMLMQQSPPSEVVEHVGTYLEYARQLGKWSAELHLALATDDTGGEFSLEPMTPQYLRSEFQTMRSLAIQNLRQLRKRLKTLPPDLALVAQRVTELEPAILGHYRQLVDQRFAAGRIRIHGDFHLGQVLWTGRDFVFLDFEGDAHKPISERRIKRSPLRDVARMVRSFHHAAYAGFQQQVELGVLAKENLPKFEPWVRHWNRAVSHAYLQAYSEKLHGSGILPVEEDKLRMMMLAYLLDQVIDELGDELQKHSDNVRAPLQAILTLTDEQLPVHVPAPPETKTTT